MEQAEPDTQERDDEPHPEIARLPYSQTGLENLRAGIDGDSSAGQLEKVNRELEMRSDPERVVPLRAFEPPWSRGARARRRAEEMSLEARLDIFSDELRSIRIANEVLSRAATMRAVEAAEAAIFDIRCAGETVRHAILNRTHLEMTRQFLEQLESIEAFRGRVSSEVLDALKERALNEFSIRMNRSSKADIEFLKSDILRLRP